jgi:hypothetical protein
MNKNKNRLLLACALLGLLLTQGGLVFGREVNGISTLSLESLPPISSQGENEAPVGSWYFTVSSQTAPAPFKGLITFCEGGGLVASGQGDILLNPPPGVPPIATPGHGAWSRTANHEYLFTFRQIFYNGDGSYAGGAKIRNAATLDKSGNSMAGQLTVDYYNENDEVVFTGTGTFTAVRILAEGLTP